MPGSVLKFPLGRAMEKLTRQCHKVMNLCHLLLWGFRERSGMESQGMGSSVRMDLRCKQRCRVPCSAPWYVSRVRCCVVSERGTPTKSLHLVSGLLVGFQLSGAFLFALSV